VRPFPHHQHQTPQRRETIYGFTFLPTLLSASAIPQRIKLLRAHLTLISVPVKIFLPLSLAASARSEAGKEGQDLIAAQAQIHVKSPAHPDYFLNSRTRLSYFKAEDARS
jgi:hypothetical protein